MTTQLLRKAAIAIVVSTLAGGPVLADALGIPSTAEEHERAAKEYDAKATKWRNWAAYHREMAEAYRSRSDAGLGDGLARVHCAAIAQDADRLAAHAEEFATFHRLRAAKLRRR